MTVPSVPLADGTEIPQLGFGVFQVPPEDTAEIVGRAIEVGYRHFDTAKAYENEAGVGEAIRASDIDRSEFYVTTKCWNADHGHDHARNAFQASFERLDLEYVDLYLIHWPVPSQDRYVETWKALIDLQKDGLVRSIGVSNFQPDHLQRIIDETGVTPVINQIELHPYLQQPELRDFHRERNIITEAWSPLAQGKAVDDEILREIADEHDVSTGQVVLRWHIQLGNVVFPKSVTPERIEQNFDLFDFSLSNDEMARIRTLDKGERVGPDPDSFDLT